MTKSILIIVLFMLFFASSALANSVSLELRVTMPQVVSSAPEEKQDSNINSRQTEERNGESIVVETTVAK